MNTVIANQGADIPQNDSHWESMPAQEVLRKIGDSMGRSQPNIVDNIYQWIISSWQEKFGDEEVQLSDDELAEFINTTIAKDPTLFGQLKNLIEQIFAENDQFTIPQ